MILALAAAFQVSIAPCDAIADSVATAAGEHETALRLVARLESRCGRDFAALYRAGRALSRAARFDSANTYRPIRDASERLLSRAIMAQSGSAAAWLEFSLLLRKRQGSMLDAQRYLRRAVGLAERRLDTIPPPLLAEMYLQLARDRQDWTDRLRWLKDGNRLPAATVACSDLGMFCENYTRPASFNELVRDARVLEPNLDLRREELLETYNRVLRYDATSLAAALGRARELALGEEWEPLAAFSRRMRSRGEAWEFFGMVEALARHRLNRPFAADTLFAAALAALPDSLRRWYRPPADLNAIPDFWARGRPLWLVPVNELELEYRARVTYALLALGDHESYVQGPETPQGDALIRYGWPHMTSQFSRDASMILRGAQLASALQALDCVPPDLGRPGGSRPACGAEDPAPHDADFSGGRWIVWTYALDRPSMIFEIRTGQRVPRYYFDGPAREYAEQLRTRSPMTFESRLAPNTIGLPLQVARFRGETPERTAAMFFGVVPAQEMGLPRTDSLATGLFLFRAGAAEPIARSAARHVPGAALLLTYNVPLPAGRYSYSIEAWSEAYGAAALACDSLLAPQWRPDSLMLSDLLLADTIRTPSSLARRWTELGAAGSPSLAFVAGSNVWIVWESYGLHGGDDRIARYRVELALRDDANRPLAIRLLERIGLGRRPQRATITLSWDAERPLADDDQPVVEWARLELPEGARGPYRLGVTVTERGTGRSASAARLLTIGRREER